jgi:hypothetical protein
MDESKARFLFIEKATNGEFGLHPMLVEEVCYLQIRLLCEVIALGCLIAHGDITKLNTGPLSKKYDADAIIKKLEQLHADFYPRPVTLNIVPNVSVHMEDKKDGFLTKTELLSVYGRCGEYLHRGTLKRLELLPPYRTADYPKVIAWASKFVNLLATHVISSPDHKRHWLVILKSGPQGLVQVAYVQAP